MTNHDLDLEAICELFLELFFPVSDSIAITAACITKNQQLTLIGFLGGDRGAATTDEWLQLRSSAVLPEVPT